MTSQAFTVANRALHLKKEFFSNEITSFLSDASSKGDVPKEAFIEKKGYFEKIFWKIVVATDSCVKLLDDGEDEGGEIAETLREHLEDLRYKKVWLIWLKEEI